jgi:hypothetical protein
VVTIAVGVNRNTGLESMWLWPIVDMWGGPGVLGREGSWCVGVSTSVSSDEDVN